MKHIKTCCNKESVKLIWKLQWKRPKHSLYLEAWCPAQLWYYERLQEKTMAWARGGKGLENSSGCNEEAWKPCYDLKESPDPLRFTASYVQQTASSDRITALSGCSLTPHPKCLLGHTETPPQWRAAINEHGHRRTAPEITECASCGSMRVCLCAHLFFVYFGTSRADVTARGINIAELYCIVFLTLYPQNNCC